MSPRLKISRSRASAILVLGGFVVAATAIEVIDGGDPPPPKPQPTPIITEVMLWPLEDAAKEPCASPAPWIELFNPDRGTAALDGLELRTGHDRRWEMVEAIELASEEHLLVCFDGPKGGGGVDGQGVVHAPASFAEAWQNATADFLAVYMPPETSGGERDLAAFVAWGGPPPETVVGAGSTFLWGRGRFVPLIETFGYSDSDVPPSPGWSIGAYDLRLVRSPGGWVLYDQGEVTPGHSNAVPSPKKFTPPSGEVVRSEDIAVGWLRKRPGETYTFTIFDERGRIVETREKLTMPLYRPAVVLPPGRYSYRVRVEANEEDSGGTGGGSPQLSRLSDVAYIISGTLCCEPNTAAMFTEMRHEYQRKDTRLLCLDGCGSMQWDSPHNLGTCLHHGMHGEMSCARASISMMVSFYGSCLSQDRITYEIEREPSGSPVEPEEDFAHGNTWNTSEATTALEWALNLTPGAASEFEAPATAGKVLSQSQPQDLLWVKLIAGNMETSPSQKIDLIRAWLESQRPIMALVKNHFYVVNGYCDDKDGTGGWIHVMDPKSLPRWITTATFQTGAKHLWAGPAAGSGYGGPRSDEPAMWTDSDGDGVMDFDEENRFACEIESIDTDGDGVTDKNDIREYVFDDVGEYAYGKPVYVMNGARAYVVAPAKRLPDPCPYADGERKENDPDHDHDGCLDGREDANRNGRHDQGENSNFDGTDCGTCGGCPNGCACG